MQQLGQAAATSVLLVLAACIQTQVPIEASSPRPDEVILRTLTFPSCPTRDGAECGRTPAEAHRGPLVFVEADSLVMTDMKTKRRVTIRPDLGEVIEVYRGQRRTAAAVAKGAGKGALEGAATGAAEALLVVGLSKLLGLDLDVGTGDAIKSGIVIGTAVGALGGKNRGMKEGEAVWERVSLVQLRQQLCRCANPDGQRAEPGVRLIPER